MRQQWNREGAGYKVLGAGKVRKASVAFGWERRKGIFCSFRFITWLELVNWGLVKLPIVVKAKESR